MMLAGKAKRNVTNAILILDMYTPLISNGGSVQSE